MTSFENFSPREFVRNQIQEQKEKSSGETLANKFIRESNTTDEKAEEPKVKKGKIGKIKFRGTFKSSKKVKDPKKFLSALGVIANSDSKRNIKIRRLKQLKRVRQIQQQGGMSNTNREEVLNEYYRRRNLEKRLSMENNQKLSPNTQRVLDEVRRIQNQGHNSIQTMNRINRERHILAGALNLMKAHENMTNVSMDFTGVKEDNILFAPSVFKENSENNILRPKSVNILSGENRLRFF